MIKGRSKLEAAVTSRRLRGMEGHEALEHGRARFPTHKMTKKYEHIAVGEPSLGI
jgi:hypothetical protein